MEIVTAGHSIGCNAVTHVVSWSDDGILAYGANRSVAIYDPKSSFGVHATLLGHKDRVTAVCWLRNELIVSGSADATLKLWKKDSLAQQWSCIQTATNASKSISCLAVCEDWIVSGSMDGSLSLYRVQIDGSVELVQGTSFKPSLPLALAMSRIPGTNSFVIAAGGTTTTISLYTVTSTSDTATSSASIGLVAKLPGHEDWLRSFDFLEDKGELLLASASQDRYIRVWRIDKRTTFDRTNDISDGLEDLVLLENKAHDFAVPEGKWKVAFEALLVSHEDWVFSCQFSRDADGTPLLLSSSADSSIIIWHPDAESEIWTVRAQLGTISTKGASTATGSTGGFWGALFSPQTIDANYICAWNKTGSIRIWQETEGSGQAWKHIGGVGGHVKDVRSLSWSPGGEFFLTTSLDQSTRLWAKHVDGTWKEFARPQIHGYDIQSIHVMSPVLFISGAEEKIVRIFQATSSVVDMLARIASIDFRQESTAEAANVPALGLSNKALTSANQGTHLDRSDLEEVVDKDNVPLSKAMLDALTTPPTEDHLQRHTLFPELEKLYGHGYEIQALTASHDGKFIVSGCRATTPDHAVLRLYDANKYKELTTLDGHSLTVTKARFSPDDQYLLSVSRDRAFCLYKKSADGTSYVSFAKVVKAHKRIIWDCAWLDCQTFAMASRDGTVSIWQISVDDKVQVVSSLDLGTAATALAWSKTGPTTYLAVGLEDGNIKFYTYRFEDSKVMLDCISSVQKCDAAITGIEYRPSSGAGEGLLELAFCSDDCSIGVLQMKMGQS